MSVQFSEKPGPKERQLKRKYTNPLFPHIQLSQLDVDNAHMADQMDTEAFLENFRDLVEKTINLPPNMDADELLNLKATLEQNYTQCQGLPGDMEPIKQGLIKLLEVIMQSLVKSANNEPEAMERIDKELEMMKLHFQLSESLLFCDLMNHHKVIADDEIIPVLLSSTEEDLNAALHLFSPEQLQAITSEISEILPKFGLNQSQMAHYQKRQAQIDEWLKGLSAMH